MTLQRRALCQWGRVWYNTSIIFNTMPTFKGFSELGQYQEVELRARFERVLKGKFGSFHSGNFKSELAGVNSVGIMRPDARGDEEVRNLAVTAFYEAEGKKRHVTFSLLDDGTLSGSLPKGFPATKEQVLEEVLRITEQIDSDFFMEVDDEILAQDVGAPRGPGGEPEEPDQGLTDSRRIELMLERPVLFGVLNRSGFRGDRVFVEPANVWIENKKVGRALYRVPLDPPIDVNEKVFQLPRSQRVPLEDRRRIYSERIKPILGKTRSFLREELLADQIIHPPITDPEWEPKFRKSIASALERLDK